MSIFLEVIGLLRDALAAGFERLARPALDVRVSARGHDLRFAADAAVAAAAPEPAEPAGAADGGWLSVEVTFENTGPRIRVLRDLCFVVRGADGSARAFPARMTSATGRGDTPASEVQLAARHRTTLTLQCRLDHAAAGLVRAHSQVRLRARHPSGWFLDEQLV